MRIRQTKVFLLCGLSLILVQINSFAQSSLNSFPNIGRESDQPIQIEAMELEVLDAESKAIFSGDVIVVQGNSKLKTDVLTVTYDGEGTEQQNITKIEASGDVVVTSEDQKATSDDAVFNTIANSLMMSGDKVVLTQGANVIVGNLLKVELDTGKAKMEAVKGKRIRVLLDSKQ